MTCGKKAADSKKATPADNSDKTPAEPTEPIRDTTTLALVQALALKVDALSTRLDEQDDNKNIEQRDTPSDNDQVGEGGKEPEHDAQIAHERSVDFIDGLLAALEDKRLEVGLAAAAKAHASATFKRHAMERDTDRDKSRKEKAKAVGEKREQQRRKVEVKNHDNNGGKTGDNTRD
eukprot:jgi/Tetstr1/457142/TSEL_043792.t1